MTCITASTDDNIDITLLFAYVANRFPTRCFQWPTDGQAYLLFDSGDEIENSSAPPYSLQFYSRDNRSWFDRILMVRLEETTGLYMGALTKAISSVRVVRY